MTAGRTMGHVALHYARREDGPAAARLLGLIGFVETQALPLSDGSIFYRFVVDEAHRDRGDGILYLSAMPAAQAALIDAACHALGVGTDREHPSVADLRRAVAQDPEYLFHIGTLIHSLEDLERVTMALLACDDAEFAGRIKITINRPRPGDPAVEARLDASPVFGPVKRHAYGRHGVQVFVETDLLVAGPLGEAMVLELDYVFPGHSDHILSVVDL
jgi:hypothetical protein